MHQFISTALSFYAILLVTLSQEKFIIIIKKLFELCPLIRLQLTEDRKVHIIRSLNVKGTLT